MELKLEQPEPGQEPEASKEPKAKEKKSKPKLPEVLVIRNFQEYVGESLLIIFSVALALLLTELLTKLNEKKETKELLTDIKNELIHNRNDEIRQYAYHQQVARTIDSALKHPEFADSILVDGRFKLDILAPHGVLYADLEEVAWEAAKSHNITAKIDISTLSLLDNIYNDQHRIIKLEDEIGKLLLDPSSRKKENIRMTLVLMSDNYQAWSIGRGQSLIDRYSRAIDRLDEIGKK
ncbi:MAG: hypothetical protein C5B52_11060 [Bacteroidetes bacterium]|nr:MAG: hypothetical protein C5B52_11060 [Bacteroidota bacterium]